MNPVSGNLCPLQAEQAVHCRCCSSMSMSLTKTLAHHYRPAQVSYNAMISSLEKVGQWLQALHYFEFMLLGVHGLAEVCVSFRSNYNYVEILFFKSWACPETSIDG